MGLTNVGGNKMNTNYNNYACQKEQQKQVIIGNITELVKALQSLAPHPECPQYKGPLFIKGNPYFKAPNEHDAMAGTALMQGILGASFSDAVSGMVNTATDSLDLPRIDLPNIDVVDLMECYSEYLGARESEEEKRQAQAHGRGTLARMSGKSISGSFNARAQISEGMQAFYDDLPKRMTIEKSMAFYAQQLDLLERAPVYRYAPVVPQMAA